MSKVFIEESTLTAIGDAIREKTSKTELIPPLDMPQEIKDIQTGGTVEEITITSNGTYTAPDGIDGYTPVIVNVPQDGAPPDEVFTITGSCSYMFYNGYWDWFIEQHGNKITTENLINGSNMFQASSNLVTIPFDLNFKAETNTPMSNVFMQCFKLEEIGDINNINPNNMTYFFSYCYRLRHLPKFNNPNFSYLQTQQQYSNFGNMFQNCYSLREIPESLLKEIYAEKCTSSYSSHFNYLFQNCYALDEIRGVSPRTGEMIQNMFGGWSGTFGNCYRAKDIIFDTQEDGTPYVARWSNQNINLKAVGWVHTSTTVTNYNSGCTKEHEVSDDATYQALKDSPDWWSIKPSYARYNHDSAVNTINSLPDTSAFLTEKGGTNTIIFNEIGGQYTDGGACNTLTAEEIAIATAKGWTVGYEVW